MGSCPRRGEGVSLSAQALRLLLPPTTRSLNCFWPSPAQAFLTRYSSWFPRTEELLAVHALIASPLVLHIVVLQWSACKPAGQLAIVLERNALRGVCLRSTALRRHEYSPYYPYCIHYYQLSWSPSESHEHSQILGRTHYILTSKQTMKPDWGGGLGCDAGLLIQNVRMLCKVDIY